MTLNEHPDKLNDLAVRKSVRGARSRSLAVCLLAMVIAEISLPEPALAQWDSVAGAVAGAMVRGMVGGGGGYYSGGGGHRYRGGARSRSHVAHVRARPTHVAHARATPTHVASRHEHAAPVKHASSGGGHTASGGGGGEPAGPGGGSFH